MRHQAFTHGSTLRAVLLLLSLAIALAGGWIALRQSQNETPASSQPLKPPPPPKLLVTWPASPAPLKPPAPYQSPSGTLKIGVPVSPLAAGLFMVNNGVAPNPESAFSQANEPLLSIEMPSASILNAVNRGSLAAGLVSLQDLVLHHREADVELAALAGWERGMNQLVVRDDVKELQNLQGRVLVVEPFSAGDLLLRQLAALTGISLNEIDPDSWQDQLQEKAINLLPARDASAAAQWFLQALADGDERVAGCLTRFPDSEWLLASAPHKTRRFISDRNFPLNPICLILNRGFAKSQPETSRALVAALFTGNQEVRASPGMAAETMAQFRPWKIITAEKALQRVEPAISETGTAILQPLMTTIAKRYRILEKPKINLLANVKDPPDWSFRPRRRQQGAPPSDPLWAAHFPVRAGPNVKTVDTRLPENADFIKRISHLLKASPGSMVRLRFYAANGLLQHGPPDEAMTLRAMDLNRDRGEAVRRTLVATGAPNEAIEVEAGSWAPEGTTGPGVEVAWFVLE